MNVDLLQHILDVSNQLSTTRDIQQVLTMAIEATLQIVRAERGYLVTLNADGSLDYVVRTRTLDETDDTRHADAMSRSILNEVIESQEPKLLVDALSDPNYSGKSSIQSLQLRSVMCVPLIVNGHSIGALYVENRSIRGAFRQPDLEPLILFANQAAVSIENAHIIADLEARVRRRTIELEQSWHAAVESNRLRTTMLGQLTHDMRNMIAIATLSMDMLQMSATGNLNARQDQLVTRADYAIDQLSALLDNLFSLSKSELQSLDVNPITTDMTAFMNQIVTIGNGIPWREGVEFHADIESDLPAYALDPIRIQQVIMNLLGNAQKFTHAGSVTLYAQAEDDGLVIGVQDTGTGIHPEHLPHIFERFKQFDTDAAQQATGGGFGLAICKELVEKHNGRISVESTPDVGSHFWFTVGR